MPGPGRPPQAASILRPLRRMLAENADPETGEGAKAREISEKILEQALKGNPTMMLQVVQLIDGDAGNVDKARTAAMETMARMMSAFLAEAKRLMPAAKFLELRNNIKSNVLAPAQQKGKTVTVGAKRKR